MKKTFLVTDTLAGFVIGIIALTACSKNDTIADNSFPSQAEAKIDFDNQSGGIYKGTLTGSSGYFKVNLQETRPFIIYKWTNPAGNIDSLFTNSLSGWISGQPITRVAFSGANGSKFWFSVNGNGTNPSIDSVYMPNHPARVYPGIAKETSANQVKVYQGVAIPNPNSGGCVNAIINGWTSGRDMTGTFLATNGDNGIAVGVISGNQINITFGGPGGDSGTLTISPDGKTISGTIRNSVGDCSHTINLSRIL